MPVSWDHTLLRLPSWIESTETISTPRVAIIIVTLLASTVYRWIVAKAILQQTEGGGNKFCLVFFIVYTASMNAWLPLVRFQIYISSRALLRCIYSFNERLITSSKGSNVYEFLTNLLFHNALHMTLLLKTLSYPTNCSFSQISCLYYKGFNCSTMHPYIPILRCIVGTTYHICDCQETQ